MTRTILYSRRALDSCPDHAGQLDRLRCWAASAGLDIVAEYSDDTTDKKTSRDARPMLDRAIYDAIRGAEIIIAATSLDRVARSTGDLERLLRELAAAGAGLYVADLDLNSTTAAGREALRHLSALIAFDKACRAEAILRGQRKARAKGTRGGGVPMPRSQEAKIASLLLAGIKPDRVRKLTHAGKYAIYRIKRDLEASKPPQPEEAEA